MWYTEGDEKFIQLLQFVGTVEGTVHLRELRRSGSYQNGIFMKAQDSLKKFCEYIFVVHRALLRIYVQLKKNGTTG
jgi:hypothetical protein